MAVSTQPCAGLPGALSSLALRNTQNQNEEIFLFPEEMEAQVHQRTFLVVTVLIVPASVGDWLWHLITFVGLFFFLFFFSFLVL